MAAITSALLIFGLAVAAALPADPIIRKMDPEGPRYQYLRADDGTPHLVDQWLTLSDVHKISQYNARTNQYHLFTRANPWVSRLLILGDAPRILESNFDPSKKTVVLIHGFLGSLTSEFNQILVPAYLAAADVNVIVLDWSAGSYWGPNVGAAALATAEFVDWVNSVTGAKPGDYYITGFSVGGQAAGILGRTITGDVAYVTACDPAERWDSATAFRPDDGLYTEAILTSSLSARVQHAQVDIIPNGGRSMPGCLTSLCDHDRSFEYLGESIRTGGFTARRCDTFAQAASGNCNGSTLRLGGLEPKIGASGVYALTTNRSRPFSQG